MKKLVLFIGLIILGLGAYSQDIRFTKGDIAPGKLKSGQDFESFIIGKIKIKDATGTEYSFVKAEFVMKNRAGKELQYTINTLNFTQAQASEILSNGTNGANYIFKTIIVKDSSGKEISLPVAEFIYDPYSKG
jgi:hypothetical protein